MRYDLVQPHEEIDVTDVHQVRVLECHTDQFDTQLYEGVGGYCYCCSCCPDSCSFSSVSTVSVYRDGMLAQC
jgi:hypothetical protein